MIKSVTRTLKKGLTRAQAMKKVPKSKEGDFRGFVYNPKTGKATWT